jgi:hypothetical protein
MIFWAKSSFNSADHDLIASIDLPIATFAPNPNANVRRTIRAVHQSIRKSVASASFESRRISDGQGQQGIENLTSHSNALQLSQEK